MKISQLVDQNSGNDQQNGPQYYFGQFQLQNQPYQQQQQQQLQLQLQILEPQIQQNNQQHINYTNSLLQQCQSNNLNVSHPLNYSESISLINLIRKLKEELKSYLFIIENMGKENKELKDQINRLEKSINNTDFIILQYLTLTTKNKKD